MPKTGSITHGEFTGDIIAGQITKALASGEPIWRAVGNVLDLFFDEAWIEVTFDPSATPIYGQGDSPCAPMTKAWQIDPLTELPVAIWFKSGWGLLDWSQWWSSAGGSTFPTRYPGPMTPIGPDYAGGSGQWADGTHSHPYNPAPPPPVIVESTLYTAKVGASLFRGNVYCTFDQYYVCGGSVWDGWTEIAPGVMQKAVAGPISSVQLDGINPADYSLYDASPLLGTTVIVPATTSSDADKKRSGLYVVDDVGGHMEPDGFGGHIFVSTNALMHRHPDYSYSAAFVHGMQFFVENGDSFGGGTFTLTSTAPVLGTDMLNWSWAAGGPAPSDERWELLTGQQFTSEGALNATIEFSASAVSSSGYVTQILPNQFGTIAGTPGVDSLAAGPYKFNVEAIRVEGASPGSITTLRAVLIDLLTDGAVLTADSHPLTSSTNVPLEFVSALASPYAFAPTTMLELRYFLRTNSTTSATLTMRYNSPARGTKLTLPFAMPITGASDGDHRHLSHRDDPGQHPRYAITDAIGTATVSGSGTSTRLVLAAPFRSGEMTLTDTILVLYGIDPTGWSDGQVLELFVDSLHPGSPSSNLTLVHIAGNSDGSDIYVGVNLATGAGQNATYTRPVALKLKRRARLNRWQLMEARM